MSYPQLPDPITWTQGETLTESRLRADPGNLAWLLTKRPLFLGEQATAAQGIPNNATTTVNLDTEIVDNWNGHVIPDAAYAAPLAGWYLCEGNALIAGIDSSGWYGAGVRAVQNSVTRDLFGNILCANGADITGPAVSDLVELNPGTGDTAALVAFQNNGGTQDLSAPGAFFSVQWAGMPASSFGDTVPVGQVVTSPQPAAAWPPGSGTLLTAGVAAGGSVITVANTTGMIDGGTLGLDYYLGRPVTPAAEAVTIAGISGGTVTTSAAAYPHGGTVSPGYAAVPVSAAFMNQQVRDIINFLAFPPMTRLSSAGSTQGIPSTTFPTATAVVFESATLDNFSGWNGTSEWVVPVSGVYYVYGQVLLQASVINMGAGIGVSGGTIQWGDQVRSQTSLISGATVRKTMRLTAGQYLQLFAWQQHSGTIGLLNDTNAYSTMIAIWRGF